MTKLKQMHIRMSQELKDELLQTSRLYEYPNANALVVEAIQQKLKFIDQPQVRLSKNNIILTTNETWDEMASRLGFKNTQAFITFVINEYIREKES